MHLRNRKIVNYFIQQKRTTQPEHGSALEEDSEEDRGRSSSDETEVLQPTQRAREETVETEPIEIPPGTRGCPLCGREFHEAAGVRRHVRQVHEQTVQEGPSRYGRPRARQSSPERQLTRQVRRLVAKGGGSNFIDNNYNYHSSAVTSHWRRSSVASVVNSLLVGSLSWTSALTSVKDCGLITKEVLPTSSVQHSDH
ncbi:hypothetical protein V1505DRAFT_356041 [Lipomyces doorenjongii]